MRTGPLGRITRRPTATACARRSTAPGGASQEAFGAEHFAQAGRHLGTLRAGTYWRTVALAVALLFGLASLLGVLVLARRVAVRVREYAAFAGQGLRQGPLDAPARFRAG